LCGPWHLGDRVEKTQRSDAGSTDELPRTLSTSRGGRKKKVQQKTTQKGGRGRTISLRYDGEGILEEAETALLRKRGGQRGP